ncbi:MAG: PEP-CTERM system TPR-repeat protein PrsT [Sulfuritalea sp.]|nr:PEP-CTERM system TPR-repeat protein PrsT [Sulfuritalea sp.]
MTPVIRSRLRTTALLLGLTLAAGCGDSPETLLASAKDYLARNDPAAATIQLKNALAKDPNSAEARFLLGRALLDGGDPVAAEVELRKALELKFSADQVAPALARALLAQGQFKKLDELAQTHVASAAGRADLKTTVGQGLALQGKLDAARAAFEAAVAAQSDYAPALLGLARMKAGAGDLAGAHATAAEILARDARNANAWLFQADLFRAEGKLAEAVSAYEKGVEINPRAIAALAALAMIHLREGKPDLADQRVAAMQQAAAQHPLTLYMRGLVAYGRKDLPAARAATESLLKTQPDNAQGLQLAGLIAYDDRSDIQAQEFLRKALHRAPGLDFARRTLVLSYLRSGQPNRALETLQPVLRGGNPRALWLPLAGSAHLQGGDAKTAEEYFRRAAKADPEDKRTQTALALARLRSGQAEAAFADLEQIAAEDAGVTADMALIAASIRARRFDQALKAIDNFEKKQPGDPVVHNLRGGALLGKGDREGARKSFEKAVSLNPAYLPAATALAQMDLAAQKPDDARKRFEAVLAKEPKNVSALLALADLSARTGAKAEDVAHQIGKAIAAAPTEPAPRLALIGLHVRDKENKKALTAVQDALAVIPDRPELLDAAGQVYQLNGDINQALATYGRLISLMPTSAHPYLRMAEIQVAAQDKKGARSSLDKGLALQPDSLPIRRALILLDIDDQNFDAALKKARALQKEQPKLGIGYLLEGDVHAVRQAWGAAATAYRAGLKAAPDADLARRLHAVLLRDGRAGEAGSFAEAWLKSHPGDSAFRLFLAESATQRKDHAAAAAHYRKLLVEQPGNPVLLNNLAWTLGQMKDPQALALAEQANRLAPNQPAVMDTLGVLLVEKGESARGLELLAKALELAPQAHVIRLNYAGALIKAGRKTEAQRELDTLAGLGNQFPNQAEVAALRQGL